MHITRHLGWNLLIVFELNSWGTLINCARSHRFVQAVALLVPVRTQCKDENTTRRYSHKLLMHIQHLGDLNISVSLKTAHHRAKQTKVGLKSVFGIRIEVLTSDISRMFWNYMVHFTLVSKLAHITQKHLSIERNKKIWAAGCCK